MKAIAQRLAAAATVIVCGIGGYVAAGHADDVPVQKVQLIKVSAKRFVFTPDQITLKKGVTVDFEVTVTDVPMGFSVPDFNTRSDLIPGTVAHVRLTPQKTGTFPFLCDIFCGSGHEDMNGVITVVD
jgi:cytochrome c oxidase subunit 2